MKFQTYLILFNYFKNIPEYMINECVKCNKKQRELIYCHWLKNYTFFYQDSYIEVVTESRYIEDAISIINCKIDYLNKNKNNQSFKIEKINFTFLNLPYFLNRLFIPLRYNFTFKVYVKNYSKILFAKHVVFQYDQIRNIMYMGDFNRAGWYNYYYYSNKICDISPQIINRFKKNKYYKLVIKYEDTTDFKNLNNFISYFLKDTSVLINYFGEASIITIDTNSDYILEALETWALFISNQQLQHTKLLLENNNENIDITNKDKLDVLKILWNKIEKSEKKKFTILISFNSTYFKEVFIFKKAKVCLYS